MHKISTRHADNDSGVSLIMSLLVLSFLTVLGVGLLTTASIETSIADNYKVNAQLGHLAEAGTDQSRENLRLSPNTITAELTAAAGNDGTIADSRWFTTVMASDDVPYANNVSFSGLGGRPMGRFFTFLRNDSADGRTSVTDTNRVISLLTVSQLKGGMRSMEVEVRRTEFPPIPSALTLDGPVGFFDAANSNLYRIEGHDQAGNPSVNGVGVIDPGDDTLVSNAIPGNRQDNYTGLGGEEPNVEDISTLLAPELTTPAGLETLVAGIASSATDTYDPGFGGSTSIGNIGAANDYRVVVVNGDCTFGPGTGYGILLVRGALTMSGVFNWNGLVLVVGQGELRWNGGGHGMIQGGMLIAKSRGFRTPGNPLGPVLASRGPVIADFNGGGGNGIRYNTTQINNTSGSFPYTPISYRVY